MIDRAGINIFEFVQYDRYLRAVYDYNKEKDPSFSYRKMSSLLGFTSPNYSKLLIDGERHLARKSFEQVFEAFGLKRHEKEYFSYLVEFARSKSSKEKNYYFAKIVRFRADRSITSVHPEQFEYFSKWYNVAIRELLCNQPAPIEPQKIVDSFLPEIAENDAATALKLLLQLGFLEEKDGMYLPAAPLLNTNDEISSMAIRDFHRQTLGLALESLDSVPVEKREFSAVTVTLSEDGYRKMIERIRQFREEALHIACDDRGVDRVMQLNMHLFPLTKENVR